MSRAFAVAAAILLTPAAAFAAYSWTDPTLTSNATKIRAVHVQELCAQISLRRSNAGLAAYAWTDAAVCNPVVNATKIRAVHITDLRQALSGVYVAYSYPAPTWANAIAPGAKIRAFDIQELRNAVDNAPTAPACSCGAWANSACGGICGAGNMQQMRTCAPANCLSQSQCAGFNASCCSCNWVPGACGAAGGCPVGQRLQTLSCNNSSCGSGTTCAVDSTCNPPSCTIGPANYICSYTTYLVIDRSSLAQCKTAAENYIASQPAGLYCFTWVNAAPFPFPNTCKLQNYSNTIQAAVGYRSPPYPITCQKY